MRQYALVSEWHLAAPIDRVWDGIFAVEDWPRWLRLPPHAGQRIHVSWDRGERGGPVKGL